MIRRMVGYWIDDRDESVDYSQRRPGRISAVVRPLESRLPHPAAIIAACGVTARDARVVQYLCNAVRDLWCAGYSYCRLRCGVPDSQMGSFEHTDGIWSWPEGLAHYVDVHGLPLPEEFLATMRAHEWHPPQDVTGVAYAGRDIAFWQEWAARHSK
jgi:hypothetical protein